MSPARQKYVLDTNVVIAGLRDRDAQAKLIQFHTLFAPFEYLSAIVVQEMRAGTRSKRDADALERHIIAPFVRRGRLVTPSYSAWDASGEVLRVLAREEGLDLGAV